ncbi:MAG: hypothetical protein ACOYBS_12285 [Flavobacterium sp.]
MKAFKSSLNINKLALLFSSLFLLVTLVSCGKKITFMTSEIAPAARGNVDVKKDKNNNYRVELEISYLAEPDRLSPAKNTYVVWMVTDENDTPINLGQIVSSSKLNVKFETVTSSKPKRIFVTAENDASIQYPGNMLVLETDNF